MNEKGSRTQLVAFRITPDDWFKYRREAKKLGWTLSQLAQMCFDVHAEEELIAHAEWKLAESQNMLEEYAKRKK